MTIKVKSQLRDNLMELISESDEQYYLIRVQKRDWFVLNVKTPTKKCAWNITSREILVCN